jgi:DHA3 family macrolide efflux protein-like MFS transporter
MSPQMLQSIFHLHSDPHEFVPMNQQLSQIALLPMILSFTSARTLGTILSFGGVGMVGGAFLMSIWGGFKQQMNTILLFGILAGIGVGVVGVRPSAILIASGWFIFLLSVPIINAASQAIWLSEVQAEIQGRVFSIRRMLTTFSQPLAFIVAGPLAQRIFEPFLESGGTFSRAAQSLVGHGHGRGIGLMMVFVAILTFCFSILTTRQFGTRSQQQFRLVQSDEEGCDLSDKQSSTAVCRLRRAV